MVKIVFALLFVSGIVHAQSLKVSNSDPREGDTISVRYSPTKPLTDSLFCISVAEGYGPKMTSITSLLQTDTGLVARVIVPDSTWSMSIMIGNATQIMKDGMTNFTCRTRDGNPTPGYAIADAKDFDKALVDELVAYPMIYHAYFRAYFYGKLYSQAGAFKRTESEWHDTLANYVACLAATKKESLEKWCVLAVLWSRLGNTEQSNNFARRAASKTGYDPIINNSWFWGQAFYPQQVNGKYTMPHELGRLLVPLFERCPRSAMTAQWLHMTVSDSLLDVKAFRRITSVWTQSRDVDVLLPVAQTFGNKKSPAYDPKEALIWSNRASDALTSGDAFRSGEYVYGFGGRIGWITALRIRLLAEEGKLDEAAAYEKNMLARALELHDKQAISKAMADAFSAAGRTEDAQNAKKIELPSIPNFHYSTIDGVSGSLEELRGKVVVLDCWFINCPGCNIEKQSLNRLVQAFRGDSNVVFLSIATDGERALRKYYEKTPTKFQTVSNGYELCQKIGVSGYPTHIVIDRSGKTLSNEIGGSETIDETLTPFIAGALKTDSK